MSGRIHRGFSGPTPSLAARYRVIGPKQVNGMNVWTVHEVLGKHGGHAVLSEQIGPHCFSRAEAMKRAKDLVKGRKLIYFGFHQFERKMVDS